MNRFNEDFFSKIKGFDIEVLEQSKYLIYALSKELKFIYFNPTMYALESQLNLKEIGERRYQLGNSVLNSFKGIRIKLFLRKHYNQVIKSGEMWKHELVCPIKAENNTFLQRVYPIQNEKGLLIINTEMYKLPLTNINQKVFDSIEKRYIQPTGQITICANCKHTKRADEENLWDWVPDWADTLPVNGHIEICSTCSSISTE